MCAGMFWWELSVLLSQWQKASPCTPPPAGALCIKPLILPTITFIGKSDYKKTRLAVGLACFMHITIRVSPLVTLPRPNFVHRFMSMGFL